MGLRPTNGYEKPPRGEGSADPSVFFRGVRMGLRPTNGYEKPPRGEGSAGPSAFFTGAGGQC